MPTVPPSVVRRWVPAGIMAAFAVLAVAQTDVANPWVVAAAGVVVVVPVALAPPRRTALVPLFAAVSATGIAVLGHGNASSVGWFGLSALVGWCGLVAGTTATVALLGAFLATFALEWLFTVYDRGWAAWVGGTTG